MVCTELSAITSSTNQLNFCIFVWRVGFYLFWLLQLDNQLDENELKNLREVIRANIPDDDMFIIEL